MMIGQNFEMVAGDTKYLVVTVTDGTGNIVDLTGTPAIEWVLQTQRTSTTALVKKDMTSDVQITNATGGQFVVTINPADTQTLAPGLYYHAARLTDVRGNVSTVLTGVLTISPTVAW